MAPRRRVGRKILVASVGVAALAYGCKGTEPPAGNLAVPATPDAGAGALPSGAPVSTATPPPPDASLGEEPPRPHHPTGNLMPPPPVPFDAGKSKDAGKKGGAS